MTNMLKGLGIAIVIAGAALTTVMSPGEAARQKKADARYDTGASDTEIVIGNTNPYSGPASAYGMVGLAEAAYFKMINDQGGVNGRKIRFISYDDAYSPPKTVEQTRKLVENDNVLFIFSSIGTAPSLAVQKYMNQRKVPQIFVASGSSKWGNPKEFPWSIGMQVTFLTEGRVFGKFLTANYPNAKIGVLYQNDDMGKELLQGLKEGLGPKAKQILVEAPAEITDPTVDAQIVRMRTAGVDVFVNFTSPKAAAQAMKKVAEIGWKPLHLVTKVSTSNAVVMKPVGFENVQGIISASYQKEWGDPQWANDPGMKAYGAFMEKYMPGVDKGNSFALSGYMTAEALVTLLKQAGDDLTRVNLMKQAANLQDVPNSALLRGISFRTGPDDFYPLEQLQMVRFKGETWEQFGPIVNGELGVAQAGK